MRMYSFGMCVNGHCWAFVFNNVTVLQYLTCLTSSRSQTDKLAFDVGLRENAAGMASYF